ncbi:MAG: hypothetical protein AB8H79_03025 [Myxococcota bacterium]
MRLAAPTLIAIASISTPAMAQEVVTELPDVQLERIPPEFSYDFGLQLGVADITYFRDEVPPWATMGVFGSWGYHLRGNDRLGPGLAVMVEGPVPLHFSASFEPTFRWDRIMGKLTIGAAGGLAVMIHSKSTELGPEVNVTPAPLVAARIGYSEGWSRIGRRLFVVLEPKMRFISGVPNPGIALQVGSGTGY